VPPGIGALQEGLATYRLTGHDAYLGTFALLDLVNIVVYKETLMYFYRHK